MQVIAFRGQGVFVNGFGFGTIHRHAASVDGEDFVIVRFRGGDQLVSVLDLLPATQATDYSEEHEPETEEEESVFGEASEEQSLQALDMNLLFGREELEEDKEVGESEFEEEFETVEDE